MIMDICDGKESMKDRPMKGFIQVLQVLLFFVGGIIIIAIIVNKSPASLFAGLGASAAILMLVFKFTFSPETKFGKNMNVSSRTSLTICWQWFPSLT